MCGEQECQRHVWKPTWVCVQESEHAVFDHVCRTYVQEQYRWECV